MNVGAKICGIATPDALDAAVSGGASHVGFVFFTPSPRNVAPGQAAALGDRGPSKMKRVGVFVDPDTELLADAIRTARLDVVQLHRTAPERIAAIRRDHDIETWAALAIKTRTDLVTASALAQVADRILYDARTPDDAALPGGMGMRFDWALLDGFRHPGPWILSGGLDAASVGDAIARTRAPLVDVSSGVESAPGRKDPARISAFLKAVARA